MLIFTCDHCGESKEFTSNIPQINRETMTVEGHTVCMECHAKYSNIEKEVKAFADEKREELKNAFFNKIQKKVQKDKTIEDKLDDITRE